MTTVPPDDAYPATERTTPTRFRERARYERAAVHAVLDEVLICHVGYVDDGSPVVLPTIHTRVGETLYLHGSSGSSLTRLAAGEGTALCVTVTQLDGLVLARSQFNHSMNYRSVVVRGTGTLVTDDAEKTEALTAVVEHVVAGRSRHSRPPTPKELAATGVVRLPLDEVSLKSRTGPPSDDPEDVGLPHWAGVIGVRQQFGPPLPAPDLPYDRQTPQQLINYHRSARPQGYR
jgi:nitroimidazol reductase NimA-like FMN-containing flavoprotein (pyridoxamine 5'-phosphate oxidase superfamily)